MDDLKKNLQKYLVEIIILSIALIVAISSAVIYFKFPEDRFEEISPLPDEALAKSGTAQKIFVEVAGAVNKPDLYEASNMTRMKEIIHKAGGLSENADKDFFSRNFNLARIVTDQEKIYIPSVWEVANGYFNEDQKTINNILSPNNQSQITNNQSLININTASLEELDTLPGVGKITGQKIIDSRPFKALEELTNKKVVNKSVFENIKNLITF